MRPPPTDPASVPIRGSLALIRDRHFGVLFWGKLLSNLGTWIHLVVAAIAIYDSTRSTLWVGLVSAAHFVPQLVLTPWAGAIADRGDLARQLLAGRAFCVAGSLFVTLAAWWPSLPEKALLVAVFVGSSIVGVGFAVGGPAQQSIVPLLVRQGEMSTAMGLNSLPLTVARVAGPVLGAWLAASWGTAPAFAVATACQGAFAVLLVMTRFPSMISEEAALDRSFRAALHWVALDRPLLALLLIVGAVASGAESGITLGPAMAATFEDDERFVGHIVAAFGIGSALAYPVYAVLSRSRPQQQLALLGLLTMIVASGTLAAVDPGGAILALFCLNGVGFMIGFTAATTLVLERVPRQLRGRVMALWSLCFVGSRPVAATTQGWMADILSVPWALTLTSLLMLGVLLVVLLGVQSNQWASKAPAHG